MSLFSGRRVTGASVRIREEGPCGNTTVSEAEVNDAKRLFEQQLPTATSGLSIVQRLAVGAANNTSSPPSAVNSTPVTVTSGTFATNKDRPSTKTGLSQRVVNSHLDYFRQFTPFLEGRFTKDTLYQFLFFVIVEKRVRMSYARRVLRTLLSYARRYLEESGGGNSGNTGNDRLVVVIDKPVGGGGRSVRLDIKLTPESVAFFRDNPRGLVVQSKRFYQLINSVGDQTNNQRLKNVVCEARRPRDLVFSEEQNAKLLAFVFETLGLVIHKYVQRNTDPWSATYTGLGGVGARNIVVEDDALESFVSRGSALQASPRELDAERTLFEFCAAFLFGFLTGARVKSTVMRLTVAEVDRLVRGGTIEKLTKGSFARVFVPERLAFSGQESLQEPVAELLYAMTLVRRSPLLYPLRRLICKHVGRGGVCGYGVYRQCRNVRSTRKDRAAQSARVRSLLAEVSSTEDEEDEYRPKGGRLSVGCPYESDECVRRLSHTTTTTAHVVEEQPFFLSGGRQLDYAFNRIYTKLFHRPRPKGVSWHSQRRRYLGAVNDKFGAVTASKSVGHTDVETTMLYINRSMHRDDTNRRAGSAVYEELERLIKLGGSAGNGVTSAAGNTEESGGMRFTF